MQDLFAIGGDLQGTYDHYRWTVSDAIAGMPIELRATGPLGRGLGVELQRADGTVLKQMGGFDADPRGVSSLRDLVLPAGDYVLRVTPCADDAFPYRLEALPSDAPDADPEPNDEPAQAVPLDPDSRITRGRLTSADRRDRFALTVDDALADRLIDVRLLWRDPVRRDLCLEDAEGHELQCRSGDQGAALPGLHLPKGTYLIEVRGDPAEWAGYILRVDDVGEVLPDYESEPNGDTDQATPMLPTDPMAGRSSFEDDDFFQLDVTGEPQLWQLDVTGQGIDHVSWVHRDGSDLVAAEIASDRTAARLSDLYLVPGRHWFKVGGVAESEYRFVFTPLGPPDPDAEREPNNVSMRAGPLRVGGERTGRLVDGADIDVYRFTLDAPDHVRLELDPSRRRRGAHASRERRAAGRRHLRAGGGYAHHVGWLPPARATTRRGSSRWSRAPATTGCRWDAATRSRAARTSSPTTTRRWRACCPHRSWSRARAHPAVTWTGIGCRRSRRVATWHSGSMVRSPG